MPLTDIEKEMLVAIRKKHTENASSPHPVVKLISTNIIWLLDIIDRLVAEANA